jgi:hypothetical protein
MIMDSEESKNSGRSKRRWAAILASIPGLCLACGQQTTDEYLGEPLLKIQGHAIIAAPTGSEAVVPALCIASAGLLSDLDGSLDPAVLPDEARELLMIPAGPNGRPAFPFDHPLDRLNPFDLHLIKVETTGEFPAQFQAAVYEPPPAAAIAPLFDGEPPLALAWMCAAHPEHGAVRESLYSAQLSHHAPEALFRREIRTTRDSRRFYVSSQTCPPAEIDTFDTTGCETKKTLGDPSLIYEVLGEHVVGVADDVLVVYLKEPATPGSYTAWVLGAPDGLAPGYHPYHPPPWPTLPSMPGEPPCQFRVRADASQEIEATYGERIRTEFGDDATLLGFPFVTIEDGTATRHHAPEDVRRGGYEIYARIVRERCPSPSYVKLDPTASSLSLSIESREAAEFSFPWPQYFQF